MRTEPNESYSNAEAYTLWVFDVSYSGSAKAFPGKVSALQRRSADGLKEAVRKRTLKTLLEDQPAW